MYNENSLTKNLLTAHIWQVNFPVQHLRNREELNSQK